jgi:hypothetical protein
MNLQVTHERKRTMLGWSLAALLVVIGFGAGCGPNGGNDDDTGTTADTGTMDDDGGGGCEKKPPSMPAAHACWHVCAETPIEVDAAADSDSSVPTVKFAKTYTVALNDDGNGQYTGTVRFDGGEEGREAVADGETKEIHFHTVGDVQMSASATDSSDDISVADSNEFQCNQGLKYSKVFEMSPEKYDVTLGPTDREQVTLVIVPLNGPAFKKEK